MEKEQRKFSKLYDAYVESIYRFIYIKVNSQEIAQDLTSEVFLKVWKSYQKQDFRNPRAFLYTTARHTVIDYYRTHKTTVSIETAEIIEDSAQDIQKREEISSAILNTIHNLHFYLDIFRKIRQAIQSNSYYRLKRSIINTKEEG